MKIEKVLELIKNADDKYPLKIAYLEKNKYYEDFFTVIKKFKEMLTDKQFDELINKFQFKKPFDQQRYLQTASEVTILYHVLFYLNSNDRFKYEPKYNGGYNPECSFEYINKLVNLEVKCPNLEKRLESEKRNTLKISTDGRIPNHEEIFNTVKNLVNIEGSNYSGVEEKKRLDNKLKDFLIHCQKKFPISDDSNFNILAISLEIIDDLDEWYLYMFDETGVFTNNSFIDKDYDYDRVDAILLTNAACNHLRWKEYNKINLWTLKENVNILSLNPDRQNSKTGEFYCNEGLLMFGNNTLDFLIYLENLNKDSNEKNKYIEYKIELPYIMTNFIKYLKSKN